MKSSDDALALLLASLDEAYDHKSWHGTNLRGSLRGLTVETALWRPQPGRHNIWEVAVHAAYWKYVVRRKITGAKRGSFPLPGSDWFPRADGDDAAWQRDLDLLAGEHRQLRASLAALGEADRLKHAKLIRGIVAHDLYHAGQIQLLKRLQQGASSPEPLL
jgi:hypothetical protein